jgi:hypothetical protein
MFPAVASLCAVGARPVSAVSRTKVASPPMPYLPSEDRSR